MHKNKLILAAAFAAFQAQMAIAAERSEWLRANNDVTATFFGFNDAGGDGRDRFMTGGLQLSVAIPERRVFDFSALDAPGQIILQFGGRMYTPEDIRAVAPVLTERPYAAFAYISAGVAAARAGELAGREALVQDHIQLELASSGAYLDFEEIQNDGHLLLGSPLARGWDNQIPAEPYLTARLERMWRMFSEVGEAELEIAPFVGASVGTAENSATVGLEIALGDELGRDLRVRETALGQSYAVAGAPPDGWSWRVFAGSDLKIVATDATLDGGFFRSGQSIAKKLVRYRVRGGFEIRRGGLTIGYALNLLGEEFEGQDDPQLLGALLISYRF